MNCLLSMIIKIVKPFLPVTRTIQQNQWYLMIIEIYFQQMNGKYGPKLRQKVEISDQLSETKQEICFCQYLWTKLSLLIVNYSV